MQKFGILFLVLFFGLTHVLPASNGLTGDDFVSNNSADTSEPNDYISDAQYLQMINLLAQSPDQKCCLKSILDQTENSSTCPNDGKIWISSELVIRLSADTCLHSILAAISPGALSDELHRPPIA